MPALITTAPEFTGANLYNHTPIHGLQFSRQIYPRGSDVYTVNSAIRDPVDNSSATLPIVMKRRSPWTFPDSAAWNAFHSNPNFALNGNISSCRYGDKIYMLGATNSPGYLIYFYFDASTDQYVFPGGGLGHGSGTVNPYWIAGNNSSNPAILPQIGALSTGKLIAIWQHLTNLQILRFAFINSDVFDAGTTLVTLSAGFDAELVNICVDASDTTHVFYNESSHSGVTTRKLWHVTIDSSGSVGTPDLLESYGGVSGFRYSAGPAVEFGGEICLFASKAGTADIFLFHGTAGIWTKTTIATRPDTGGGLYGVPTIVSPTELYLTWWEENDPNYPSSLFTGQYSIWNGSTATAKALLWDAGANQVTPGMISPDGDITMHTLTSEFSGGKLRVLGWTEYDASFHESEVYLEVALGAATPFVCRVR